MWILPSWCQTLVASWLPARCWPCCDKRIVPDRNILSPSRFNNGDSRPSIDLLFRSLYPWSCLPSAWSPVSPSSVKRTSHTSLLCLSSIAIPHHRHPLARTSQPQCHCVLFLVTISYPSNEFHGLLRLRLPVQIVECCGALGISHPGAHRRALMGRVGVPRARCGPSATSCLRLEFHTLTSANAHKGFGFHGVFHQELHEHISLLAA